MKPLSNRVLIYDWNVAAPARHPAYNPRVTLADETLRDGLQSPSAVDPPIGTKLKLLHLMEALGIHACDLGLPAAGARARADITELTCEIACSRMKIKPYCAVRTVVSDIAPLVDISEKAGYPVEAAMFIGSSPIRMYAERWRLDHVLKLTEQAVTFAVKHGLPVMYVTEDTTRARPSVIKKLYTTAITCGARRITLSDTVGHATPAGVANLVRYMKDVVRSSGERVKIDFHGHRDRGLDIANALAAIAGGVDQVHATALGIGERTGNCAMDLLLVNLRLEGVIQNDLSRLPEYCQIASAAVGVPIPPNYPAVGRDAFRTATGVHAAAVIKAMKRGDHYLANRVYSGVPADFLGRKQEIEIGFMSGASNVRYWLAQRGIDPSPELIARILELAKNQDKVLTDEEVLGVVRQSRHPLGLGRESGKVPAQIGVR